MKLLTASSMALVDAASASMGVSTLDLMLAAGRKTARVAAAFMGERRLARAVIVAGKGNNGGDGLAAAVSLRETGREASVLLLVPGGSLTGDPARVLARAKESEVPVRELAGPAHLPAMISEFPRDTLVVDAIFGTGFRPPARGAWSMALACLAGAGLPVVSIDLPSGVGSDDGRLEGEAVTADLTVALGALKPSLFIWPSASRAGRVLLADIGHPPSLLQNEEAPGTLVDAAWCRGLLALRRPDAHKGTCGHVLIVAGSRSLPGAALLAAAGAVRGGAGLVTLAAPGDLSLRLLPQLPELLPVELPSCPEGSLSAEAGSILLDLAEGKSALVVGPGLTTHAGAARTVSRLLADCALPLVADADALNTLVGNATALRERRFPTVITPHPGELGRLLGSSAADVQRDRLAAAREAGNLGAFTLLKGAGTITADPNGRYLVNTTGNPGMASGGMGDVLAGLLGALMAQGMPPWEAAGAAAYLHGLAGDLAAREIGPVGFTASEVAARLPAAYAALDTRQDVELL